MRGLPCRALLERSALLAAGAYSTSRGCGCASPFRAPCQQLKLVPVWQFHQSKVSDAPAVHNIIIETIHHESKGKEAQDRKQSMISPWSVAPNTQAAGSQAQARALLDALPALLKSPSKYDWTWSSPTEISRYLTARSASGGKMNILTDTNLSYV